MSSPIARSVGILLARIAFGAVFLAHGLQKFQQNGWAGPQSRVRDDGRSTARDLGVPRHLARDPRRYRSDRRSAHPRSSACCSSSTCWARCSSPTSTTASGPPTAAMNSCWHSAPARFCWPWSVQAVSASTRSSAPRRPGSPSTATVRRRRSLRQLTAHTPVFGPAAQAAGPSHWRGVDFARSPSTVEGTPLPWILLIGAIVSEVAATLSLKGSESLPALYLVVVVGYATASCWPQS